MNEIDKVAIIGAGNLGSRHLQAMALVQRPTKITVIDPSEESLKVARERWEEMQTNPLIKECKFSSCMDDIPDELDVVLVATSSGPRRGVVENLLARSKIRYLILEKVLFQKMDDYSAIEKLLINNNVLAWVNCGRRCTDFYRKLRDLLKSETHISMIVAGGNWGLGCNSIHMLDIYAFMSEQIDFKVDSAGLDKGVIDSKRQGYIEFTGELRINSPKGSLSLLSYSKSVRPSVITIDSEHYHINIYENRRIAEIFMYKDDKWILEEWKMDGKLQSRVTQELIQELMETGDSKLTAYEESVGFHKVLLKGFLEHLKEEKGERCNICPIT